MYGRVALLFLVALKSINAFGDDGDLPIAGTNDKCADYCSKTYAAHTTDKPEEQSCRRGCKIFSLLQIADRMKSMGDQNPINATAINEACDVQCNGYFSDRIYRDACLDGCKHQTVSDKIRVEVDQNSPLFPFANKLINDAMGTFSDISDRMKDHFDNFKNWFKDISSESTGDNSNGDGPSGLFQMLNKLLGRQGEPFSENKEAKPVLLGGPEDVADRRRFPTSDEVKPKVFTGHPKIDEPQGVTPFGNEDDNGEPILIVKMIPVNDENLIVDTTSSENLPAPGGDVIYTEADGGWWACLARRTQDLSTLSRWLLCTALMLSLLCMMWLCLALLRSQRLHRQRLYMQYRPGKSDVIYFTPPPTYEKSLATAYCPLNNEKKVPPPSPPPQYEPKVKDVDVEKQAEK